MTHERGEEEQTKDSPFVSYFLLSSPPSVLAGYSLPPPWEHSVGGGEATRGPRIGAKLSP